jgi:phage terminase Nu1 subunit (DNA packaging protein)
MRKVDLAQSLGITTRAFDYWGVPPAASFERTHCYNIKDVVDNRVAQAKGDHVTEGGEGLTKAKADLLLVKQKVRNQKFKNDLEEGQYVKVEILEQVFALAGSKIGAELDTFYMLLKRKYNTMSAEMIADIDTSARNCSNAIAALEFDLERELKLEKDES